MGRAASTPSSGSRSTTTRRIGGIAIVAVVSRTFRLSGSWPLILKRVGCSRSRPTWRPVRARAFEGILWEAHSRNFGAERPREGRARTWRRTREIARSGLAAAAGAEFQIFHGYELVYRVRIGAQPYFGVARRDLDHPRADVARRTPFAENRAAGSPGRRTDDLDAGQVVPDA